MGICVAFGCKEIGIHKFPRDLVLKRKWEKALRKRNYKATAFSKLCRKHFKNTDYETTSKTTGFPLQKKILKKSAIPSIFIWNTTSETGTSARAERLKRRDTKKCLITSHHSSTSDSNKPPPSSISEIPDVHILLCSDEHIQEIEVSSIEVKVDIKVEEDDSPVTSHSQATQTPTLFTMFSIDDLLVNDESVHFYTGLETYAKFKLVLSTLCPMAHYLQYKGSQVLSMGIEDQFLIMLMKLRRNKCDFELSKFFGVSRTVISNIFITWLNFAYDLWSLIDIWPERELVDYYMPSKFKKYQANTRIIIDGTEIAVAKPKNTVAQQATFSSTKNKNTIKFLLGATPGGLISYCSEGYGGSTSDTQMIEQSRLLEKCDSGDTIMTDRCYNVKDVEDIFARKNIGVMNSRVPGVKHDRQLANQCIHIKRLIELSKTFLILKSDLNAYYTPLASRIFFVCIMLCNFRESIVKLK